MIRWLGLINLQYYPFLTFPSKLQANIKLFKLDGEILRLAFIKEVVDIVS